MHQDVGDAAFAVVRVERVRETAQFIVVRAAIAVLVVVQGERRHHERAVLDGFVAVEGHTRVRD